MEICFNVCPLACTTGSMGGSTGGSAEGSTGGSTEGSTGGSTEDSTGDCFNVRPGSMFVHAIAACRQGRSSFRAKKGSHKGIEAKEGMGLLLLTS